MHGCLIAPKKAMATKMIFTKRGYERAWNFGERQRNRQFLSVHTNMITLQKDPKEHFNLYIFKENKCEVNAQVFCTEIVPIP
jgi:hypothetical protein